jgi:hypothetical protein
MFNSKSNVLYHDVLCPSNMGDINILVPILIKVEIFDFRWRVSV